MILIVEDDADLAASCSRLLEACGYDVRVALSANDGIAEVEARYPELLISDCCMSGMTGLELSRYFRSPPLGYRFPILLMSGSLERDVAVGNGYDAFIKKPFLAETLLSRVRSLLQEDGAAPGLAA
jgi:two-component system chemotaxis response regulator CheY